MRWICFKLQNYLQRDDQLRDLVFSSLGAMVHVHLLILLHAMMHRDPYLVGGIDDLRNLSPRALEHCRVGPRTPAKITHKVTYDNMQPPRR